MIEKGADLTSQFSRFLKDPKVDLPDKYVHLMIRDILNINNDKEITEMSFIDYVCAANYSRQTYIMRMVKETKKKGPGSSDNTIYFEHKDPDLKYNPKFVSQFIKGKK